MKNISIVNIFRCICLVSISVSAIAGVALYGNHLSHNNDNDTNTNDSTNTITWNGQYNLGVDDNPDFVASPTQQSIAAALHDQFPVAFPQLNDFFVQITGEKDAIAVANAYSNIYSGTTNITWDVEQKLNLPSSVLLSPFYTQTNTMYENQDVTEQMVFDKLVSEYSNSLNINQLLLTQRNDVTGEFTVQPKANSTVYNTSSQLNAQINVTQSAVLTYPKTTITTGTKSGTPTFKYRGYDKTPTYSINSPSTLITLNVQTGEVSFGSTTEYAGGIAIVIATYVDTTTTSSNTYTATWTIWCCAIFPKTDQLVAKITYYSSINYFQELQNGGYLSDKYYGKFLYYMDNTLSSVHNVVLSNNSGYYYGLFYTSQYYHSTGWYTMRPCEPGSGSLPIKNWNNGSWFANTIDVTPRSSGYLLIYKYAVI